jgi:hypothetical protein
VPLHRLSEHRAVDRGRRQGNGELRSRIMISAQSA